MAYSLVRLTLYGLLSALEADLRTVIRQQVVVDRSLKQILSAEIHKKAQARALQDGVPEPDDYIEYIDFGDVLQILNAHRTGLDNDLKKMLKAHAQKLERLIPVRNRVMHSRPLRFDDFSLVTSTINILLQAPSYIFSNLRELESEIRRNPHHVLNLDVSELERLAKQQTHNLPIPDFDETGFLGRKAETTDLMKACRGPWPVVTVVGEGGVGKTALALQVAYELLETENYDAVVWTSSKTTRLTLHNIETIDGAIRTALGAIQDISKTLAGTLPDDPLNEVLDYLNSFKILLILDNLETILDDTIRAFLSKLNGSSKIVITSRVSVGELDYRFRLASMSSEEAVQLLRATAQVRRVNELVKTKNDSLKSYCTRMKNNPAFIKWFVTAVQCGKRPEEVLVAPRIFLDFCLSNVYNYLSIDAKNIAKAMLAVPGKHAQPVLSYLTDLEDDRFQEALQQVVTTNIAIRSTSPTEGGTFYELCDLPRLYLLKNHNLSHSEVLRYQAKKKEIVDTHERLQSRASANSYSLGRIQTRTRDDTVVAKYLIDALAHVRIQDFNGAFDLISKAKKLAPAFYEVYRVEAWAHALACNYPAAVDAYETAIELEPRAAPLRYWYGGFLLRQGNDAEAALRQFEVAYDLDNTALPIKIETGRALMYLGEFERAEALFQDVIDSEEDSVKLKRIAYDCWCQISLRHGSTLLDTGKYTLALEKFSKLYEKYMSIPRSYVDDKIVTSVVRSISYLQRLENEVSGSDLVVHVVGLLDRILEIESMLRTHREAGGSSNSSSAVFLQANGGLKLDEVYEGEIAKIIASKRYGFITTDKVNSIFFRYSDLVPSSQWLKPDAGDRVRFCLSEKKGRAVAKDIEIVLRKVDSEVVSGSCVGARKNGVVKSLVGEKFFGFIVSDGGAELFFHGSNVSSSADFSLLQVGTAVTFLLGKNRKGTIAVDVKPAEDFELRKLAESGRYVEAVVQRGENAGPAIAAIAGVGAINISQGNFLDTSEWEITKSGDVVRMVVIRDGEKYFGDSVELIRGGYGSSSVGATIGKAGGD